MRRRKNQIFFVKDIFKISIRYPNGQKDLTVEYSSSEFKGEVYLRHIHGVVVRYLKP